MTPTDEELIAACLSGQSSAFGQLVQRHQDRLFNTLVGVLGSHDDARDVAQEAFILAFQKLQSFRGQSAFYSWLFRIALNVSASLRRRRPRGTTSLDGVRERTGAEPMDQHPNSQPGYGVEQRERQQMVRAALMSLSEEYRTVLVLKEIEGLKYEEIAEEVGCPVGTVRSRIHRARLELRDLLQNYMQMPTESEELE